MTILQGVAGLFIYSENPQRLREWYETVFGLEMEVHGDDFFVVFPHRDLGDPEIIRQNPVFAIRRAEETLAPPSKRGFQAGFRVDDIEETITVLRSHGIDPAPTMTLPGIGIFTWIHDPDGSRLELYEELFPDP